MKFSFHDENLLNRVLDFTRGLPSENKINGLLCNFSPRWIEWNVVARRLTLNWVKVCQWTGVATCCVDSHMATPERGKNSKNLHVLNYAALLHIIGPTLQLEMFLLQNFYDFLNLINLLFTVQAYSTQSSDATWILIRKRPQVTISEQSSAADAGAFGFP